MEIKVT